MELKIPTGTPVKSGDVIGIGFAPAEPREQAAARGELEAARAAWRSARTESRQTQEDLATLEGEAAALSWQEVESQVAGPATDPQFAARCDPGALAQCAELRSEFARASSEEALQAVAPAFRGLPSRRTG